uniref:Uncharacterized protein n=1 Tax=Mesocestoides corti TaxID=53468 RepID=A0A5K3ES85_MESCO
MDSNPNTAQHRRLTFDRALCQPTWPRRWRRWQGMRSRVLVCCGQLRRHGVGRKRCSVGDDADAGRGAVSHWVSQRQEEGYFQGASFDVLQKWAFELIAQYTE